MAPRSYAVSDLTFDALRDLLRDEADQGHVETADWLVGTAIVLTAVGAGSTAPLALIGAKNEIVKTGKALIEKLSSRRHEDSFAVRGRRLAAAHALIAYVAFFEAADEVLEVFDKPVELLPDEKVRLAKFHVRSDSPVVQPPHPVGGINQVSTELAPLYREMAQRLQRFLGGLAAWEQAEEPTRGRLEKRLADLPKTAITAYRAAYVALAAKCPEFALWTASLDRDEELKWREQADTKLQRLLDGLADASPDLGLVGLAEAVRALTESLPTPAAAHTAADLETIYTANVDEQVLDDRDRGEEPEVVYPRKAAIFVPQAVKVLRFGDQQTRLEDDAVWDTRAAESNVGDFIARYLSSPYSTETPLLILGHPGAGKSLLTEMLAARLAIPDFNPIRIELRNVDARKTIDEQVEDQIKRTVGSRVDWAEFARDLSSGPPLVIFDGFDELLQVSGRVHADYLSKVRDLQKREARLGRPLRAIVTSRVTLIDKALIPHGSTVIRLQEFDEPRQRRWISIWNEHNAGYFEQTEPPLQPFALPDNNDVRQLAQQPLLLLMLALFDSDGNQLHRSENLDRTLLYDTLLRRFVRRQRRKPDEESSFDALSKDEQHDEIDEDMRRMGVAALGMFGRRALHIHRDQLDADLKLFELEREVKEGPGGKPMSQAELLFGSFFFVVHESRAKDDDEQPHGTSQPATYEFLHNTFGEFLTADFILRVLLEQTDTLRAAQTGKALRRQQDALLDGENMQTEWYAALIYTPLFSRPVILAMLREWRDRVLERAGVSAEDFEVAFDALVNGHIDRILSSGTPPSGLLETTGGPGESLPLLGHYAVYTLNLVLLRAVLATSPYGFQDVDAEDGITGRWDRLTHLWRSWFALDQLQGLAGLLETSRDDGKVQIAARHFRRPSHFGGHQLGGAFATARALGDDLTAGLAGFQMYDLGEIGMALLSKLNERLDTQGIDLSVAVDLRRLRAEGWGGEIDRESLARAASPRSVARPGTLAGELQRALDGPDTPPRMRLLLQRTRAEDQRRWASFTTTLHSRVRLDASAALEMGAVGVRFAGWAKDDGWSNALVASQTLRRIAEEGKPAVGHGLSDIALNAGPPVLVTLLAYGDELGLARSVRRSALTRLLGEDPVETLRAVDPQVQRDLTALLQRDRASKSLLNWVTQAAGTTEAMTLLPADVNLDLATLAGDFGAAEAILLDPDLSSRPRTLLHAEAAIRFLARFVDDALHLMYRFDELPGGATDRERLLAVAGVARHDEWRLSHLAVQLLEGILAHAARIQSPPSA